MVKLYQNENTHLNISICLSRQYLHVNICFQTRGIQFQCYNVPSATPFTQNPRWLPFWERSSWGLPCGPSKLLTRLHQIYTLRNILIGSVDIIYIINCSDSSYILPLSSLRPWGHCHTVSGRAGTLCLTSFSNLMPVIHLGFFSNLVHIFVAISWMSTTLAKSATEYRI